MKEEKHVKKEILTSKSKFRFSCHQGLQCFGQCCKDVNIFLTPYDVLRMKKSLNLSTEEFLSKYTNTLIAEKSGLPVVHLKMRDDASRSCPFISSEGCEIYKERPWSCRMYPLDKKDESDEFNFITDNSFCLGLNEEKEWQVKGWIQDQGIDLYDEKEELFKEISQSIKSLKKRIENPDIVQMFYLACYDLDRFKRFIFESKFLDIFDLEKELIEKIKIDDFELMNLGFKWIKFGMIDRNTLKIKKEVIAQRSASSQ